VRCDRPTTSQSRLSKLETRTLSPPFTPFADPVFSLRLAPSSRVATSASSAERFLPGNKAVNDRQSNEMKLTYHWPLCCVARLSQLLVRQRVNRDNVARVFIQTEEQIDQLWLPWPLATPCSWRPHYCNGAPAYCPLVPPLSLLTNAIGVCRPAFMSN